MTHSRRPGLYLPWLRALPASPGTSEEPPEEGSKDVARPRGRTNDHRGHRRHVWADLPWRMCELRRSQQGFWHLNGNGEGLYC